eukprot:TRINITY_DN28861_c0_g1_i1.p1 TRINITY_DN28861_c0_g1~~TRINITY_DN28861_c0_g1_i1.p1  ORF type:complete len:851 (+),score=137.26 TRINITY_DN28861_c0_g1_i1:192-2744(+)
MRPSNPSWWHVIALAWGVDHARGDAVVPLRSVVEEQVASATGWTVLPRLLELEPDNGPQDGGTRVRLHVLGHGSEDHLPGVRLQTVGLQGGHSSTSKVVHVNKSASGEDLFFLMPNLTVMNASVIGVLVSLVELPAAGAFGPEQDVHTPIATPSTLFFRVTPRLVDLMPQRIYPCCELKVSGGQRFFLAWSHAAGQGPPSRRPVVRFTGRSAETEEDGELAFGTLTMIDERDNGANELPSSHAYAQEMFGHPADNLWHVTVLSPSWPKAEGHIILEVSWNGQQFASLRQPLRFVEEDSLFGEVVGGIDEFHLQAPPLGDYDEDEQDPDAEEVQELVTVSSDDNTKPKGRDPSHVMLKDREGDSFALARLHDASYLEEDIRLVHDLFILICSAGVGGVVASCLRAPSVIGYLMGGSVVGPGGLDVVVMLVQIESVAQLGVCMLLFCLGLEMSFAELRANSRAAFSGILSIVLLCGFVVLLATCFAQTSAYEALCIGLFASLSSTPVSLLAVADHGLDPHTVTSRGMHGKSEANILLGVLLTQDMALAGILAALPTVFQSKPQEDGAASSSVATSPYDEDSAAIKLQPPADVLEPQLQPLATLPVLALFFFGQLALAAFWLRSRRCRRLPSTPTRTPASGLMPSDQSSCFQGKCAVMEKSLSRIRAIPLLVLQLDDATFSLVCISFAFASSYATDSAGLSVELGAFVAGLTLKSFAGKVADRAERRLAGMRDVLVAFFFAAVGLVVNVAFLIDNLGALLSVVAFVFISKTFTSYLSLRWIAVSEFSNPSLTALRVSFILAHIGEFGFVLAAKGSKWGVLSRHVYLLLMGANAVSLCLTPPLFRFVEWLLPRR